MSRSSLLAVLLVCGIPVTAGPARADAPRCLVLPFRTLGISDTTEAVFRELLSGEMEGRGLVVMSGAAAGSEGRCDGAPCAAAALRGSEATHAVYGSLSRLGDKVIVRVQVLRAPDEAPYFSDVITAATEEDLDAVSRRFAEGIASGRTSADRASIESVTRQEAKRPARREARRGVGVRAGFLVPTGGSYGGEDRLTALRLAFKYETHDYFIETTPVLGLAWGSGNVDWTALDLYGARVIGLGDIAGYAGAGLGVHSVRAEKREKIRVENDPYPDYEYEDKISDSETTLSLDAGIGLLALRTYSLEIMVDLRYHYVFADFDKVNGKGAHGIALTFGTSG